VTESWRTGLTKPSMESDRGGLFVDTWGWLVLEDSKEAAHARAVAVRRRHTDDGGVLVTTDYVLDEVLTRLFARRPFAEAKAFCDEVFEAEKTFTDLTSFVVMKELGVQRAHRGFRLVPSE